MNEKDTVTSNDASTPVQPPVIEPIPRDTTLQSPQPLATPPSDPTPVQPTPLPIPSKKSKKPFILAGIIMLILAVVGGGTAAYALWYQNPTKVLADSITTYVQRENFVGKGTFTNSGGKDAVTAKFATQVLNGQVSMDVNIATPAADNIPTLNISGNMVYDAKDTVYIKVNDAMKLLDTVVNAQIATLQDQEMTTEEQQMVADMVRSYLEPTFKKLDGQWIKITDKSKTGDEKTFTQCVTNAAKVVSTNKNARDELVKAYTDHPFMVLDKKLGARSGSLGFRYKLDQAKAEAYDKAVKNTAVMKEISACDDKGTDGEQKIDTAVRQSDATLEIWADRWTHKLTDLTIIVTKDKTTSTVTYTPDYTKQPKVDIPTNAITPDELGSQLEMMLQE